MEIKVIIFLGLTAISFISTLISCGNIKYAIDEHGTSKSMGSVKLLLCLVSPLLLLVFGGLYLFIGDYYMKLRMFSIVIGFSLSLSYIIEIIRYKYKINVFKNKLPFSRLLEYLFDTLPFRNSLIMLILIIILILINILQYFGFSFDWLWQFFIIVPVFIIFIFAFFIILIIRTVMRGFRY